MLSDTLGEQKKMSDKAGCRNTHAGFFSVRISIFSDHENVSVKSGCWNTQVSD